MLGGLRLDVGWTQGRGGRSAGALNSASQAALLTQKIQSLSPPSGALSAALHPAPGDGQPNGALGNDSFHNWSKRQFLFCSSVPDMTG